MKKLFTLSLLSLALMAQAQVYYLLPGSADVNASEVTNVYDYLPFENDGTEQAAEVSPERRAYNYLADELDGSFVTIKDLVDGLSDDVKVLWVNIDRVGLSLEDFDAMFDADVTAALKAYVQNGGNLFVSKQAARLVSKIERTDWWPNDYQTNGYFDVIDEWFMCVHFCCDGNIENPFHASLKYMEDGQGQDELEFVTRFPMVSGEGTYRRTDNNCAWGDWSHYLGTTFSEAEQKDVPLYGGCDPLRRSTFEEHINGKVLGGWGHTRGLDYAGFIEFYPTDTYAGRVMAMGLAAYQWGAQNTSENNVKNLTKGILEYLAPSTPTGLNEVKAEKVAKAVVDGRVVILKNGARYNVCGQMMK